jgi:hypothetical protein
MQWSRRSISWTSFSSPWVRARDSNRNVDLAVGRPIVPAHTGGGYRAEPQISPRPDTDHKKRVEGCTCTLRSRTEPRRSDAVQHFKTLRARSSKLLSLMLRHGLTPPFSCGRRSTAASAANYQISPVCCNATLCRSATHSASRDTRLTMAAAPHYFTRANRMAKVSFSPRYVHDPESSRLSGRARYRTTSHCPSSAGSMAMRFSIRTMCFAESGA